MGLFWIDRWEKKTSMCVSVSVCVSECVCLCVYMCVCVCELKLKWGMFKYYNKNLDLN
jgi:hypothetical protein